MKLHYSFLLPFVLLLAISGCTGTRAAYKAAAETKNPEAYALVVAEHYSALVKEAADRKDAGTLTGSALEGVQAADRKVKPLVIGDPNATPPKAGIEQLAKAYTATKSAEDQTALQKALNDAVLAVSEFINTLKGAGQ